MTSFRARDYVHIALAALCIAFLLKTFVLGAYRIPSASMEPTLLRGDFVLVNKFLFGARSPQHVPLTGIAIPQFQFPAFRSPQHGDLLVFELPEYGRELRPNEGTTYVKRCIALPGETVSIVNRNVLLNGERQRIPKSVLSERRAIYPEGFGDPRIFPNGAAFNEDNYGPILVPARGHKIAVTTDNFFLLKGIVENEGRRVSIDSAGTVLIDGERKALYEVEKDYYFVLGDNRGNSFDSRFWGFVPEDRIVGNVMLVYFSLSEVGSGAFDRIRWERIGSMTR